MAAQKTDVLYGTLALMVLETLGAVGSTLGLAGSSLRGRSRQGCGAQGIENVCVFLSRCSPGGFNVGRD